MVDVAVVHASEEGAELIEWALRSAGWSSQRASPLDFKRGRLDLPGFLSEHDPPLIVWDIAVPLDENWIYCQTVMAHPCARGRRFILTTGNLPALHRLDTRVQAIEFLGTPSDVALLCTELRNNWPRA
jgi:hypothetical protein